MTGAAASSDEFFCVVPRFCRPDVASSDSFFDEVLLQSILFAALSRDESMGYRTCPNQQRTLLSNSFASADRDDGRDLAHPRAAVGILAGWGPAKELTKDEATHELHFQTLAPSGALQIG
jgi:hypothetical protein